MAAGRSSSLRGIRPDGPNSAEAAYLKGRVLQEVGNTPLAITWLKTALEGRPHDPEILRRLSAAAYDLGDRETLLTALNALTEVSPRDSRAWRSSRPCRVVGWVCLSWLVLASGCGGRSTDGQGVSKQALPPLSAGDQALYRELETKVNDVINDNLSKYSELRYDFAEGLLKILDQVELTLSGKAEGDPPRFLSKLEPQEERDHFQETVRRWQKKTGKDLRAEVDTLKSDVASRTAGKAFHPEFQRKFSQTFDDFIAIDRIVHAARDLRVLLAPDRK